MPSRRTQPFATEPRKGAAVRFQRFRRFHRRLPKLWLLLIAAVVTPNSLHGQGGLSPGGQGMFPAGGQGTRQPRSQGMFPAGGPGTRQPRSQGMFPAGGQGTPQPRGQAELPPALAAAAEVELPSDPATVIAVVGQSRILLGDLMPKVKAQVKNMVAKSPQTVPEDQIHAVRVMMLRSLLRQTISNKMMRESFLLDQVATQAADKRREAAETMASRARQMFAETRLPELQKALDMQDLDAIDQKLREEGSSLQSLQNEFVDQMLSHLYRRSKIEQSPEVSMAEIYEHYQANQDRYRHGARARWEQLTVQFKNFPDEDAAREEIWAMLQEARFGGSMQAVAREKSQEPFAGNGGVHDWTNQGSLASKALDQAIFDPELPLNQISDVIEDANGLHVVRVLEREPAGVTRLAKVQEEIREIIKKAKVAEAEDQALAEMKAQVPVWSLFPDDVPGAMPLPEVASEATPKRR